MSYPLSEKEEFEIAERFERGKWLGANDAEAQILQTYLRHQRRLRQIPLPPIDAAALTRRMKAEMKCGRRWMFLEKLWRWRFLKPAAAGLGFVATLFLLYFIPTWGNPIAAIQINKPGHSVSWRWERALKAGQFVIVPNGAEAKIQLIDRSTLECATGTRLAVQFGQTRRIRLDRGSVRIHAAKNTDHPMIVETPMGDVRVTGTVFTVEIKK